MHMMHPSPAVAETVVTARSAVRPAIIWVVRASGLAQCAGGPGVAVASVDAPDGRARTLVRRKEGCTTLALDLLAVIDGIEAALLDAALTIAPQDRWLVEVRTTCPRLSALIEGKGAPAAAAPAPRALLDRLVDLLTDIADMGGNIAILTADAATSRGLARAELDRHLHRRAAQVVRPFPTDRADKRHIARPVDISPRAGATAKRMQGDDAPSIVRFPDPRAPGAAIIQLRSAI